MEWLCGQRLTKNVSFVSSARDFCDTILKKEKELNRHKEDKHTFPCNKCDFVGESNGCLSTHMIMSHVIGGFFEKIRNEE